MAYEIPGLDNGVTIAAADLSAAQFKCVVFSATGVAVAGAGVNADGILQGSPVAGDPANVMHQGTSKAVAGAAITAGAEVASDAAGKVVTAVSTDFILGKALEAAAADGEIITVLISKAGIKA